MPEVSVIVPIYKAEKYLSVCIDSILAQTFTDFELILVDDGSPDSSGNICDTYAEEDNRIHVIHKENGGAAAARNTGVNNAKGKYVTFVDSDDTIDPRFLSTLILTLRKYNGDICVSNYITISEPSTPTGIIMENDYKMSSREAILRYGKSRGPAFRGPMAKLVKTEIAKNNPFPVGRRIAEDLATNYRYYNDAEIITGNDSALYFYYLNSSSLTNQKYNIENVKCLDTLEELLSFFKSGNYNDLFNYYHAEYIFELFNQYANIHSLGISPETEKTLLRKLRDTTKSKIPDNIYSMEPLIGFLVNEQRPDLLDIFIPAFLHLLYRNRNTSRIEDGNNTLTDNAAERFRHMLKTYAKSYGITPNNHPEWFNFAFPKTMKIYWNTQGIKNKFKRK